jgi:hypothetical protein
VLYIASFTVRESSTDETRSQYMLITALTHRSLKFIKKSERPFSVLSPDRRLTFEGLCKLLGISIINYRVVVLGLGTRTRVPFFSDSDSDSPLPDSTTSGAGRRAGQTDCDL